MEVHEAAEVQDLPEDILERRQLATAHHQRTHARPAGPVRALLQGVQEQGVPAEAQGDHTQGAASQEQIHQPDRRFDTVELVGRSPAFPAVRWGTPEVRPRSSYHLAGSPRL